MKNFATRIIAFATLILSFALALRAGAATQAPRYRVNLFGRHLTEGAGVDFGTVYAGGKKVTRTLALSNLSQQTLNLSLSASAGSAVTLSRSSLTLKPGTSAQVQLVATASGSGPVSVPLQVTDGRDTLDLYATFVSNPGLQLLTIPSATIALGALEQPPSGASKVQSRVVTSLTLANSGGVSANATITFLRARGASPQFSLSDGLPSHFKIAPGASVVRQIALDRSALGPKSETLRLSISPPSNTGIPTQITSLALTADVKPRMGFALYSDDKLLYQRDRTGSPGAIDFGTTGVSIASNRALELRNTGQTAISLGNLALPTGFSVATVPSVIGPGQKAVLTLSMLSNCARSLSGALGIRVANALAPSATEDIQIQLKGSVALPSITAFSAAPVPGQGSITLSGLQVGAMAPDHINVYAGGIDESAGQLSLIGQLAYPIPAGTIVPGLAGNMIQQVRLAACQSNGVCVDVSQATAQSVSVPDTGPPTSAGLKTVAFDDSTLTLDLDTDQLSAGDAYEVRVAVFTQDPTGHLAEVQRTRYSDGSFRYRSNYQFPILFELDPIHRPDYPTPNQPARMRMPSHHVVSSETDFGLRPHTTYYAVATVLDSQGRLSSTPSRVIPFTIGDIADKAGVTRLTAAQFGAVGDGVTDDTEALNALFAAPVSGSSVIYDLGSGTYRVGGYRGYNGFDWGPYLVGLGTAPGPLPENIRIVGNGAKIVTGEKNGFTLFLIVTKFNRLSVEGITFQREERYFPGDTSPEAVNAGAGLWIWPETGHENRPVESVTFSDSTFVNCHRAISTYQGGPWLKTDDLDNPDFVNLGILQHFRIERSRFLFPYGSNSTNTGGGGQAMMSDKWVTSTEVVDSYFDGAGGGELVGVTDGYDGDVSKVPNLLPIDGFVFGSPLNTTATGNYLTHFWVEGITGFVSNGIIMVATDSFEMPLPTSIDPNAEVMIPTWHGEALTPGQRVYFEGAGFLRIKSVAADGFSFTVSNPGEPGNAVAGTRINGWNWLKIAKTYSGVSLVQDNKIDGYPLKGGWGFLAGNPAIRIDDMQAIVTDNDITSTWGVFLQSDRPSQQTDFKAIVANNNIHVFDLNQLWNDGTFLFSGGGIVTYGYYDGITISKNRITLDTNKNAEGVELWTRGVKVLDNTLVALNKVASVAGKNPWFGTPDKARISSGVNVANLFHGNDQLPDDTLIDGNSFTGFDCGISLNSWTRIGPSNQFFDNVVPFPSSYAEFTGWSGPGTRQTCPVP